MHTMTDYDVKPWYRQFWPWFIILLPATAVVGSLYSLSLAMQTTDSLVMDAGDGVDVVAERHLAAEHAARSLGLEAVVRIDPDSGVINATLTSETAAPRPTTLALEFSHPAFAARDLDIELVTALPDADGNPTWTGYVRPIPTGRWYVVLREADEWRLTGTWSGGSTIRLEPANPDGDGNR